MLQRSLVWAARALAVVFVMAFGVASLRSVARADEASGRWTGLVEARTANYYWERSTRVVVPSARVTVESPNGIRIHADYLVDVIASASIAQTGGGSDKVYTELRHAIGTGIGKTVSVGN